MRAILKSRDIKEELRKEEQILAQQIESMGFKEISADTLDFSDFLDRDGTVNPEKRNNTLIAIALTTVGLGTIFNKEVKELFGRLAN